MTSIRGNGVVRFRFFRPDVKGVSLAGDFNDWRETGIAMQQDQEQGWWVAEMQFEPGEYRFRYLADGRWYTDFASHGVEMNKHGWDSVLVVNEASEGVQRSLAA